MVFNDEPADKLADLYDRRKPAPEMADIAIDTGGVYILVTDHAIVQATESHSNMTAQSLQKMAH